MFIINILNSFKNQDLGAPSNTEDRSLANYALPIITVLGVVITAGYFCLSPLRERAERVSVEGIYEQMKRGLCLENEDYIKMTNEEYQIQYSKFCNLYDACSDPDKLKLAPYVHLLNSKECRLLLQYLTETEKARLTEALSKDVNPRLIELINQGQWQQLFWTDRSPDPSQLTYAFLAAYCKGEIDIEDLATAMTFHRAWFNSKGKCEFLSFDEIEEKINNLDFGLKQSFKNALKNVKKNQKYVLMVNSESLDSFTQRVIEGSFLKERTKRIFTGLLVVGDLKNPKYGMMSYGIAKKILPSLAPVIHLTPSLEHMFNHVRCGLSDFALFFPREETIVHGSTDKTIFAPVHDLFHTGGRWPRRFHQPKLMDLVAFVKVDPAVRLRYTQKLNYKNKVNPVFKEVPTKEEVIAFLLDRVIGEIVDGSYIISNEWGNDVDSQCKRALFQVIESVLDDEFHNIPDSEREEIYQKVGDTFEASRVLLG